MLGVEIRLEGNTLVVEGGGPESWREPRDVLDAGNSATTMRLLAGALAGRPFLSIISGDSSLLSRPMGRVVEPLRRMGAIVMGRNGDRLPPLVIRGGGLRGIDWRMEVESAQVKSAVLLAGLQAEGETTVRGGLAARDHTERMLALMGADLSFDGEGVTVRPGTLGGADISIPGDISSAAFLMAAAVLVPGSHLVIREVGLNPTRAGFLSLLNTMGAMIAEYEYSEVDREPRGTLEVRHARLRGVEVEPLRVPSMIDELPLVAVVATQAEGETVVRGASELRVKESDRIAAVCGELRKMGAYIEELPDGFVVRGPVRLRGAEVDPRGDHRIAMALAVAALVAEGPTIIRGWECTEVSFPGFLKLLGFGSDAR
jgi:3-phosphoshikimate 1-carboxyvinyltransferase